MIRQLKQSRVLRELWPGEMRLVLRRPRTGATPPRRPQAASAAATQLPRRPDASALSEAIPLFYIGRNKQRRSGWSREAGGRAADYSFSSSRPARFARRQSEPAGCAMMFLAEPFELDVDNQGSRFAGLLAAASEVVARRAPLLGASSDRSSRNGGSLSRRFRTLSPAIAGIATQSKRSCSAASIRCARRTTTICRSRNSALRRTSVNSQESPPSWPNYATCIRTR